MVEQHPHIEGAWVPYGDGDALPAMDYLTLGFIYVREKQTILFFTRPLFGVFFSVTHS